MIKKEKEKEYFIQYWVGLMDGDGSVQVNHWRKKKLQYRLVIKLKNDSEKRNISLLERIKKFIGGSVKVENNQKNVLWVENHRKKILEIISHFEKYPPLTSRLFYQLQFLKESIKKNDINWYLENRNMKYPALKKPSVQIYEERLEERKGWLSGFIEAKGCFTIRKGRKCSSNSSSFSISQKDEPVLLQEINQFFGEKSKVKFILNSKEKKSEMIKIVGFYLLEIYKKDILKRVISHCTLYPLYGEKNKTFLLFSLFL